MNSRTLGVVVLVFTGLGGGAWAQGKADPQLVGEWRGDDGTGVPIVFSLQADGQCGIDEDRGRCSTQGGVLSFQSAEVGRLQYRYRVSGDSVTVSGGDLEGTITLRKVGGGKSAARPAPAAPSGQAPGDAPEAPEPVAQAPKGPGQPVEREAWGLRFTAPPGWKVGEKDGLLVLGSDTEAGLILVRFMPGATREQVLQEYAKGLNEEGLSAQSTGPARPFKAQQGEAVAGELAGSSNDGQEIRARAIAFFGKNGSALSVVGLTTAAKYPTLKARVDQLAQTVRFSPPKAPPAASFLAGSYWYYHGSSSGSYSRENKLTLCTDGQFFRGGEMMGSGSAGSAATAHQNGGRWTAVGNPLSGTVTLTYGSGETETLEYVVSQDPKDRSAHGPAVSFGRYKYQKTGSGQCN
jgi:hypothetical protein